MRGWTRTLPTRSAAAPRRAAVPSGVDPPPTNITWDGHADRDLAPGASRRDRPRRSRECLRVVPPPGERIERRDHQVPPSIRDSRRALTLALGWLGSRRSASAHQYPTLRVGSLQRRSSPDRAFPRGESSLQTVAQASQGVEIALPAEIVLTATGFLSSFMASPT